MGVLTWNLFHGRDFPPNRELHTWRSRLLRREERDETHVQVNRPLLDEFAGVLAGLPWEVALLQEAPPRWRAALASRCGASATMALTSRNWLPPLQNALADWNPDLIASSEGGSNMVLVRSPARIVESRPLTLTTRPETRRMLFTRIEAPGGRELCVANVHLSTDARRATDEVVRAAARAVEWAGPRPLVFGGDLNLRPALSPAAFDMLRDRFGLAPPTGDRAIDHLLGRGLRLVDPPQALPAAAREVERADGLRIRLSDHAPVAASVRSEIVRTSGDPGGESRYGGWQTEQWRGAQRGHALQGEAKLEQPEHGEALGPRPSATAKRSTAKRSTAKRSTAKRKGTKRPAAKRSSGPDLSAKNVAELRDALRKQVVRPLDLVMLTRERIESVLDDAVDRGKLNRKEAQSVVNDLLKRGRKQTNDVLSDLEQLLGRGRNEIDSRTKDARDRGTKAARRARREVEKGRKRVVKTADPALAQADRLRRRAGAPGFPISAYDDLSVGQVKTRLTDLSAAELRKVRDYERRHGNRKGVLSAVEGKLS